MTGKRGRDRVAASAPIDSGDPSRRHRRGEERLGVRGLALEPASALLELLDIAGEATLIGFERHDFGQAASPPGEVSKAVGLP